MFADDWPSITWSVLDYYRRPKLGYAAVRAAMQRLLPSVEYDPEDPTAPIAIHVVNDFVHAFGRARVTWRLTGAEARALVGERVLDIPADGVVKVADLGTLAEIARGGARLEVRIVGEGGKTNAEATLPR